MALHRVDTPTKAEVAYRGIRAAIRDGLLEPGQRVTLQGLADELGMSLTPVREALRVLASDGLVEQAPQRGTFIAQYTRAGAQETYQLREVLEALAVDLAVRRATEADIRCMAEANAQLEEAVRHDVEASIPALNAAFHFTVYRAARSPLLFEFIERLWNGGPFQAISLVSGTRASTREHRAIVGAVRARDAQRAAELIRNHIRRGSRRTLATLGRREQEDATRPQTHLG